MQYYTVTPEPMLLEYSLLASREPVTVSPPSGDPVFVTLTFIVSKPKAAADVQLGAINFTFPHGKGAGDLTAEPVPKSSASISTTGKDKWLVDEGPLPGTFIAHPESGKPVTISGESLTITFAKLQINRVVGTVEVTLGEKAAAGAGEPTLRKHTMYVPKFPPQFFFTGFSSTTPTVKHGGRATLVWQGSDDADYLMLWGDAQPKKVGGGRKQWESDPLTSTTTFMLQVTAQSEGETVVHRAAATVIVENPNLAATDLRIGGTYLGYNDPPNEREFMLYNDDGSDRFPGKYGGVYVGNKAATLRITEAGDLSLNSRSGTSFLVKGNRVAIGAPEPQSTLHVNSGDGIRLGLEKNGGGQLLIVNNPNDDSIYLEAVSKDGIGKDGKGSAKKLYLGTPAGPKIADLPSLVLHADVTSVRGRLGVGIGETKPQNALDVNGGVVIGSSYAGAEHAPDSGLKVQGDVILNQDLKVQNVLRVMGEIYGKPGPADPDGVLTVKGILSCTGRLSSWNPIDVYFPDKKKWYRIAYYGSGYATWDVLAPSDAGLKEDVRPISGALDKVKRLRGVTYRWNESGMHALTRDLVNSVSAGPHSTEEQLETLRREERRKAVEKLSGDHIGLIAQDVEAVVPETVSENEDGHKCVRYPQLVALLVEAIKEQNAQIQELSNKVSALARREV